jgi:glycosyltransferase involved in cell wall biosynthesis
VSGPLVIDIRANGRAGIARYGDGLVRTSMNELAGLGIDVTVVTRHADRNELASLAAPAGVQVIAPPPADDGAFVRRSPWFRQMIADVRPTLYYTTNYLVEPGLDVPFVVTVHDLIRLVLPAACTDEEFVARYGSDELESLRREHRFEGPHVFRQYFERTTRSVTAAARLVATVSRSTAADLVGILGVERDRIAIVPSAVAACFVPAAPAAAAATRRQFELPDRYFICVGTAGVHKRVVWLIEAFRRLVRDMADPVHLVIAGGRAESRPEIRAAVAGTEIEHLVRFVGYVTDQQLARLYTGALAFLSASEAEGFGLPPAEALACGCLPLVTDLPAHREVLGDAARYFDVDDQAELVRLMHLAGDSALPDNNDEYVPPDWGSAAQAFLSTLRSCL